MVEISEITDRKSLEAWLLEQDDPKAVSAIIAHRAAMRVLPIAWQWFSKVTHKSDMATLRVLRAPLTSEVACFATIFVAAPIAAARAADVAVTYAGTAADTAAARDDTVARADAAAARAAASAISHAAKVSGAADAAAEPTLVAIARVAAAEYSTSINLNIWPHIRRDCSAYLAGEDFTSAHLWPGDGNPLAQVWEALKKDLSKPAGSEATARGETGLDWSFWIDWYDRALTGTEDRWDMLTEIALLDSKIWEGDPSVLMDEIYSIQARHSAKATPFAERISFNEETHKWRADPESGLPDDRALDVLDKVRDAVDLLPETDEANSPYAEVREDSARMVRRVERYADRGQPAMIHDTIHSTLALIQKRADNGQCPSFEADPLLAQLRDDLLGAAQDLYLFDEKVRHVVDTRNLDKAAAAPSEVKSAIAQSAEQIAPLAEGSLAEDLKDDALIVLGGFATPLEMAQALYRVSSRISRIMLVAGKRLRAIHKETAAVAKDTAIIIGSYELARNASVWIAKIFP